MELRSCMPYCATKKTKNKKKQDVNEMETYLVEKTPKLKWEIRVCKEHFIIVNLCQFYGEFKNKRSNEWGNRWNPLFIHELHQVKLCLGIFGAQVTLRVCCPGGRVVENPPANAWDVGLNSGLGRSPRVGNGNLFQYSCLENSTDRGLWQATIYGLTKSQTQLSYWGHTVCAPPK